MSKKKIDLSQYNDIVSRIRISHDAYSRIQHELQEAYDAIGSTATPVCLLITGESRTGKSSVVRDLLETYLPRRVDDRTIRTVVYAVAPSKATVKSLLESLLKGLGDPYWSRGSESNMTQRLYTLLDAVECKMIILDEFQHLCDKGQRKKLDLLADWLKVLLETCRYGLVAVGLPAAASVVHNHVQLVGRFDNELKMPLLDWQNDASAKQFRGILRQFQQELRPFQLPELGGREMGLRMYLASAGRIGLVAKLLDRAVHNAIRADQVEIRLPDLAEAYERAIWSASKFPVHGGPFGAALELISGPAIQTEVLANAAQEEVADLSSAVQVFGSTAVAQPGENKTSLTATKARSRSGHAAAQRSTTGTRRPIRTRPGVKRELGRAL